MTPTHEPSDQRPDSDPSSHESQRRHGRMRVEELTCYHDQRTFGTIVDLSPSGMRILRKTSSKIKTDDIILLTLTGCGQEIRVKARVKWANPVESKKTLIGMEFLLASDETIAAIRSLCQLARIDTRLGIYRKPA